MKLLIFSDVHRQKEKLLACLDKHEDADIYISLGDTELKQSFLVNHDIIAVKGNYPFDPGVAYCHMLNADKLKLLITHGHKYKVQNGLEQIYEEAYMNDCDFAFYGHTHIAKYDRVGDIYIINPGALSKSRDAQPESYLVMAINKEKINLKWHHATTHEVIKDINLERAIQ